MANKAEIIDDVKKAVRQLIGCKESYTKMEFSIIYTGTTGLDVNPSECHLIFRDQEEISFPVLLSFFVEKLAQMWDPEMKALELFQNLDKKGKYFIDTEDIVTAWREIDCKLPLDTLVDCFDTVAPDGTLDYFNFKNMYLRYLSEVIDSKK
ncbi:uncharacterized protein LOC123315510 [Coccinella septempunctata]|uniref:uncharacterized protein LOC123315510 n=1 Tax=Coccinella septempunctata TaxID=41139 RepID=UPI001D088EED|nr:uncharacterized protein LOC123315510 [Coccinella septempunctata]